MNLYFSPSPPALKRGPPLVLILREIRLGLGEFRAGAVAVGGKGGERLVIALGGIDRSGPAGRGSGARDGAEAVRRCLERGFELGQRLVVHARREIKLAQKRADRDELVLHGGVLLAGVVEVGSLAHHGNRLVAVSLEEGEPRRSRERLNARLARPVF